MTTVDPAHMPRHDVRFGSKADMCGAKRHVRFTPESDIDCVFGMSAMGQKRTSARLLDQLIGSDLQSG